MPKPLILILIVFAILFFIPFIFLFQHTVEIKEVKLNNSISFDDVTIELNKLVIYNFEDKKIDPFAIRNRIGTKLPRFLVTPYTKISYFFSSPYVIDNEFYHTSISGKYIFNSQKNYGDYSEYIRKNLDIDIVDSVGVVYGNGNMMYYDTNSNEVKFRIKDDLFPIERLKNGVKIIIKNKDVGIEKEINISNEDFFKRKYNDIIQGEKYKFLIE